MRLLVLCWLLPLISLINASGLLSKTINADGSKEFRIAKQIKHNTCLCQCRCVPENMDLFARRPAKVPPSPDSNEVDGSAVKEEKRLKASMVQELTEFTTQSAKVTTTSKATSHTSRSSRTLARSETGKTEGFAFNDVRSFVSSTEIPRPSETTILSEESTVMAHTSTVEVNASPNETTNTSGTLSPSTFSEFQLHETTATTTRLAPPTKMLNSTILLRSFPSGILNSIDAVESVSKERTELRNNSSLFPLSSTTSMIHRTVTQERRSEFSRTTSGNTEQTTKELGEGKPKGLEITTLSTNYASSPTVVNLNTLKDAFKIFDSSLRKGKQAITSAPVTKRLASLKNDTSLTLTTEVAIFSKEVLDNPIDVHSTNSSLQKAHEDFENKIHSPTTSTTRTSTTSEAHTHSTSVLTAKHTQTKNKTATEQFSTASTSQAASETTREWTTVSSTPLSTYPSNKTITEPNFVFGSLLTTQPTTETAGGLIIPSTIQTTTATSRDLISVSIKPSPTKPSTHLTIEPANAQNGQRSKGSSLVKNSIDSAKHAVALEATSVTAAMDSTTTSSAASYSVLMKKVELPRGLPERWKQLVLQLKTKLEALKVRNSLLNHTLTVSPTPTKPPSTHPDVPKDENTETDKPIGLSTRHFADPLSSSRQQLLEGIFTTGGEINKMVGKPSTTKLGTKFLSSTQETTASSATSFDGIIPEAKEVTKTDDRRAQSEEPKSGTISSTATITNFVENFSKSLGSSISGNSSLSELISSTATIYRGNQPFKDVKMPTDSVISKETSSDKSALNPSLNSKITSAEANVETPTQIQSLAEDLTANTSLLIPQSRTRIIQHSASKVATEATLDSNNSSKLSMIRNFVNSVASLRNITVSTTRMPELTSSGTEDVESVGGFVISKEDASSEERLEPSGQRESGREAIAPTHGSSSKNSSVPFMMQGTSVYPIQLTTRAKVRRVENDVVTENNNFEKQIREERIRYEQAKRSREEQLLHTTRQTNGNEQKLREELLRRSEELQRRIARLKAEEIARLYLLEKQQRREEERLRKIAVEKEQRKFAEFTSTVPPLQETVTERIHYRLRPAQVWSKPLSP